MSLSGALEIGRTGLIASQAGMRVTGHNMANAATEGYSRQSIHLAALPGEPIGRGQQIGRGVQVLGITRETDLALQSRLRDAIGQQQGALIDQRFLTAIESLQNELSENDLSSLLSTFFNSFSELANNPGDPAMRAVVVQEGQSLANRVADLRGSLQSIQEEVDASLAAAATQADDLLDRIAVLNDQIARTEAGVGEAASLRDQRDGLIAELAQLVDVSTIEHPGGTIDLFVGSTPVLLGGDSRGLELRRESVDGQLELSIRVREDGTRLLAEDGQIGALMRQRAETVDPALETLDTFAAQLIFQVNRLHAQGQGQAGFTTVSGNATVGDITANLNSLAAGLPFRVENGSFHIHVTHLQSGQRTVHQIAVDGDTMSMDDLIAQINTTVAVPNVTASVDLGNRLRLDADAGYEISFSDDSSGALAALGVNTFFVGSGASDIAVAQALQDDPSSLSVGLGHVAGSNGTALAIAALQDEPVQELGGVSLRGFWQASVNDLAVRTKAANDAVESTTIVRDSLSAQLQAISGVSLDEEAINLLKFQRQFQAAARFIQVVDETLQTLLSIG